MIYAVSDLHSCYSKFIKSIPKDCNRLIILGDLFNKGREQEEMILWWIKNYNNPDYIFIWGNHEIRLFSELSKTLTNKEFKDISSLSFSSDHNINITNVVIDLIKRKEINVQALLDSMAYLKFYHIEKVGNITYTFSHASWEPNVTPEAQDKKNLIYDTIHLINQIGVKDNPKLVKYCDWAKKKGLKHIIGHFPVPSIFKQQAPYIYHDTFYFIDNAIFRTANPMVYFKLSG